MNHLLHQLNLTSLPAQLPTLYEDARRRQLSYEAFLETVCTTEITERRRRSQLRRSRSARLPFPARLEQFDFSFQPTVSERLVRELAGLSFLQTATNVILIGPPGVGKTHLACSLATAALEAGHSALFVTLEELSKHLSGGTGNRSAAALRRFIQPTLLVLDEVGYTRLNHEQAHGLFELLNARYLQRPTIITSNLSFTEWGNLLGDHVLATALLDRVLHHAEVIAINGRSYRLRQRSSGDTPAASS